MAGGAEELVGDILQQVFFVTAVFLILISLVFALSGNAVFKDYYAKDLGLLMSTLYSSNGQTNIAYEKLDAKMNFAYNFTPSALLIANDKKEDKSSFDWKTRKVYGHTEGIEMTSAVFRNPSYLFLIKDNNFLDVLESNYGFETCSESKKALIKNNVDIIIDDSEKLFLNEKKERSKKDFESVSTIKNPLKIKFIIKEYELENPVIKVMQGNNNPLTKKIICPLHLQLENSIVELEELTKNTKGTKDDSQEQIIIELQIPKNKPGINLYSTFQKTYLMLFR